MDILGVGPLELLFILIIALIVLGPSDMVKAGRTIGRFLRRVVTSPTWRMVQQTSRDLRNLPNALMRDAGLEEEAQRIKDSLKIDDIQGELDELRDIQKQAQTDLTEWTTPPSIDPRLASEVAEPEPVEDQAIVDAPDEAAPAPGGAPPAAEAEGEDGTIEEPPDEGSPDEGSPDEGSPDEGSPGEDLPGEVPPVEDSPAEDTSIADPATDEGEET
jgi:Sec-independent protein translocase protein TatA